MPVDVVISVPDDLFEQLREAWHDVPRHTLEALAAEAYRAGVASSADVQRLLGLESRWQVDAVLKRCGAYLDYSEDDLRRDVEAIRESSES